MKQWRESDRMKIWDEQRVGMYIQVRGSRESHGGGKWIVRLANLKKGERERERERERDDGGPATREWQKNANNANNERKKNT